MHCIISSAATPRRCDRLIQSLWPEPPSGAVRLDLLAIGRNALDHGRHAGAPPSAALSGEAAAAVWTPPPSGQPPPLSGTTQQGNFGALTVSSDGLGASTRTTDDQLVSPSSGGWQTGNSRPTSRAGGSFDQGGSGSPRKANRKVPWVESCLFGTQSPFDSCWLPCCLSSHPRTYSF